MRRQSTLTTVLWLLAIALLPLQMANAHLHMCLDGQDSPVSVHVSDLPHQAVVHTQDGHNNVDVDVSASVSAKKVETVDDFALYVLGAYCLALMSPDERTVLHSAADFPVEAVPPFDLHPPPRGPPSLASL